MASQFKSQDPWRRLSTPDITQLVFLDLARTGWKASRIYTHMRLIQLFNSKETTEYWRSVHLQYRTRSRDSTKTMMHSLTTTIRTLPYIAGLQAYGVWRTKRHLYRLWSFTTRCETPVRLHHTHDWLSSIWQNSFYLNWSILRKKNVQVPILLVTTFQDLAQMHNKKGSQIDIAVLDFSKAFDMVSHDGLLTKPMHYGIDEKIWLWIYNFL